MALYADIIALTVQGFAAEGETVNVSVKVRNLYTAEVSMAISGLFYYNSMAKDIKFPIPGMNIQPGGDGYFYGSFTMPNKSGSAWVKSWWYGADGQWYGDDEETIPVSLGVPPTSDIKNFDFKAQAGTYNLGSSVPYNAPYEYKGKAQVGYLTISLGTGVYPSFFTKHTFPRESLSFDGAADWTPGELSGAFILPATLELGQTYSIRAKLETADGKQETDTDWGAIKIAGLVPTPEFSEFAIASFSKV